MNHILYLLGIDEEIVAEISLESTKFYFYSRCHRSFGSKRGKNYLHILHLLVLWFEVCVWGVQGRCRKENGFYIFSLTCCIWLFNHSYYVKGLNTIHKTLYVPLTPFLCCSTRYKELWSFYR